MAAAAAVALVADGHPAATPAATDGHPTATPLRLVATSTHPAATPTATGVHPAATNLTSHDAGDSHLAAGGRLVSGGQVKAEVAAVAAALDGLAAGDSHRAIAAATGLHRTTVARVAEAAAEGAVTAVV